MKIVVDNSGIRLDKFLADNTDYSREHILKMIKSESIKVNDKLEKPSYKVELNDEIDIDESFTITSDKYELYSLNSLILGISFKSIKLL